MKIIKDWYLKNKVVIEVFFELYVIVIKGTYLHSTKQTKKFIKIIKEDFSAHRTNIVKDKSKI